MCKRIHHAESGKHILKNVYRILCFRCKIKSAYSNLFKYSFRNLKKRAHVLRLIFQKVTKIASGRRLSMGVAVAPFFCGRPVEPSLMERGTASRPASQPLSAAVYPALAECPSFLQFCTRKGSIEMRFHI